MSKRFLVLLLIVHACRGFAGAAGIFEFGVSIK
jgi:hypothetical protein